MVVFNEKELIYQDPTHVFEAFTDILEAIRSDLFSNVSFDEAEGSLTYYVYGETKVQKLFDMTQGTPEVVADMLQWLFSMLDGAANL